MTTKEEAVKLLQSLVKTDLHDVARKHGVTVISKDGKVNKGWAGHALERHLGLQLNTSRSPNLGSWELKSIPLKYLKDGRLVVKETMAVTMIDPDYVKQTPFEDSHLLTKLRRFVLVPRIVGSSYDEPTYIHSVHAVNLEKRPALYKAVKADYELVQRALRTDGFGSLTGKMGVYIQPRTKGAGHGSTTRAFYARTGFLAEIIAL